MTNPTFLRIWMGGAIVGLAIVTALLLSGVWFICYAALSYFHVEAATRIASGATGLSLLVIGYLEYGQPVRIERLADAHAMDREAAPELHRMVTRVAAQYDVPVPTIAVSERAAPEALAIGFRPERVHLVLSLGTIDALEPAELEAVVAHELAHVANRDAMVMTAASLPVVLAAGVLSRLFENEAHGYEAVVTLPLAAVSVVVWFVGRMLTAGLSRARETAADRAAAAVIGSPAALAGALTRLERGIAEAPARDLRDSAAVSSLSILPLEPPAPEKVMLGPDGDVEPTYWLRWKRFHHWLDRTLFRTHPPIEGRLETLATLERDR